MGDVMWAWEVGEPPFQGAPAFSPSIAFRCSRPSVVFKLGYHPDLGAGSELHVGAIRPVVTLVLVEIIPACPGSQPCARKSRRVGGADSPWRAEAAALSLSGLSYLM